MEKSGVKDTRVPLAITLVVMVLCVLTILIAGYFHGNMHIEKVIENLNK